MHASLPSGGGRRDRPGRTEQEDAAPTATRRSRAGDDGGGGVVSKERLEAEQGIYILLFRRATSSEDVIQKICSQRNRGGTCHAQDPARQSRECFVHKWTFLDSLAVPCFEK
jgi:hypothetical protein